MHILGELTVSDLILHWRQLGIYKLVFAKWLNGSDHKENINIEHFRWFFCSKISFFKSTREQNKVIPRMLCMELDEENES